MTMLIQLHHPPGLMEWILLPMGGPSTQLQERTSDYGTQAKAGSTQLC